MQLLSHEALQDLSGAASRCTAFALYSKTRHVPTSSSADRQLAAADPQEEVPPSLPFSSQPLMVLAPPAEAAVGAAGTLPPQQQEGPPLPPGPAPPLPPNPGEQQQQHDEPAGSGADELQRTLHCFYASPPPGCTLLPLAFTDSCGELQHAELLDVGPESLGLADDSSCQLAAAAEAGAAGSAATQRICRAVLRRCLALLSALRAASHPPCLLHGVAIAAAGMQPCEQAAWRQLAAQDAALQQLGLPDGAELAVLDLQALPPARCGEGRGLPAGRNCNARWLQSGTPAPGNQDRV